MRAIDTRVHWVVDSSIFDASSLELFEPSPGLLSKIGELPELDRFRWTNFRACWLQTNFLTVIAESALEGAAVFLIPFDDTKWTGGYAITATVANVRLDVNSAELCPDNRTRRTSFQASRFLAVFADIGRKCPRCLRAVVSPQAWDRRLLDEFHMSPGRSPNRPSVVV